MPNRRYQKGRHYEYKTKKLWERAGYFVIRSAGSKSPVDLVAISEYAIFLIQVRVGKSSLKKAKKELRAISAPAYVGKIIEKWSPGGKVPIIKEVN